MYDELVKMLRVCGDSNNSCGNCPARENDGSCPHGEWEFAAEKYMLQAADAIEELQEDNAALNGTVTNLLEQIKDLGKPRWISTEELLPKDLQNVLVLDDGRVTIGHCEHFYGDEQIYVEWHDTLYYQIDPPYWMPLPQPPKEG